MQIRRLRTFAVLAAAALVGTALAAPSASAGQAPVNGVDKETIEIVVLASDLDGLRARGFNLGAQLTTPNIVRRAKGYADLYGPINGRTIEFKTAVWDPLDATTFSKACTQAVLDNQPFMVINANGFRADQASCITADNDTPFFMGEATYAELQKASGKNLVSLALPAEVNGAAAAAFVDKSGVVPAGAKVGIVSSNEPQRKAAADVLEKELKKRKFNVLKRVEVNTLQADTSAANRESGAAVASMREAGVENVFVAISPTTSVGYFQEFARTNPPFKNYLVDVAGAACTTFSAPRLPAEAAGIPCITTYDGRTEINKTGIRKDSAFEAKCRSQYAQVTGWKPSPGAAQGGSDIAGQHWDEDLPKEECTMMSVLLPAIKAAGKNLTWDKVHKAILANSDAPMAYMSGGKGGFAKDKPYMATQVHLVTMQPANASTPKDANGQTYNGCPLPLNCWVPQVIDGQEWFPAKPAANG